MKIRFVSRVICGMIMLAVALCGCAPAADSLSFEAMDTLMSLTVGGADGGTLDRIKEKAEAMDRATSAVDENSEIYALNHSGSADLSGDTAALVERALELSDQLDGYFDPTIYPAVYEWGFTTGEYDVPDESRLAELAHKTDYRAVRTDGNSVTLPDEVMLDLGAIAKGWLADEALGILADSGADYAVLDLGGTIALYGEKPDGSDFRVGIADPSEPASYFGYLSLSGGVVATSGGYERYFEKDGKRYIHILDPSTAAPADNGTASVSAVTSDGASADALSTALFVMGVDRAAEYYRAHGGFEFALLTDGGQLYLSEGIADSFTMLDGYDYKVDIVKRNEK